MKNMNILTEIDTKQMNSYLKSPNKTYINFCASVPLCEFISIYVFYTTLAYSPSVVKNSSLNAA
jgi:hypothetical protein